MILDKTKPHAIFLDIDGTVMENGGVMPKNETIPEKNLIVLRELQKRGHKILINTGRGHAFLPETVLRDFPFDGYVTGIGSHVEIGGRTVFNSPLSHAALEDILDYMFSHRRSCRFQGYKTRLYYDPTTDLSAVWTPITSKEDFYRKLGDDFVSKVTIDRDLAGEYLAVFEKHLRVYRHQGRACGEATAKDCNKARGMLIALDALGIPVERSIAAGDSINDTDMLLAAGTSIAMGNAYYAIKNVSDYVTTNATDGGIGKALEALLL